MSAEKLEPLKRKSLVATGKVKFADWVNKETHHKLIELKKRLSLRRKDEVIDKLITDHYYLY